MSDLGHEALRDPIDTDFFAMDESDQTHRMAGLTIGLVSLSGADAELDIALEQARGLGWTPFRWQNVLGTVVRAIQSENIELRPGRNASKERGLIVNSLLDRIEFDADNEPGRDVRIFFTDRDGVRQEVCQDQHLTDKQVAEAVRALSPDTSIGNLVFGGIIKRVGDYARRHGGLALGESRVGQIDTGGNPHFLVAPSSQEADLPPSTKHDDIIPAGSPAQVRTALESSIRRHSSLLARRAAIEHMVDEHEITVVPAFTFDRWPSDTLMTHLRKDVGALTDKFMAIEAPLCDDRDLKYQTLFRLTTYGLPEIFENGRGIEEHMFAIGAFRNWRNILRVGAEQTDGLKLNEDLVQQVISEQLEIIRRRLARSELPLEELLVPSGMFAEKGWYIQKKNGDVHAVRDGGVSDMDGVVPLEFRQIDTELADKIHGDLHYIHTPRADMAFGMYVEGDELPFSVLALQRVDRDYKKNAQLYQGYDPDKCYDLTRLYSRPGTPGNASSTMFTLAFNHLRSMTDTQAVLSAFMPSYATGISMTSSKMDRPVLVKPLQHRFGQVGERNGEPLYENMTRRRLLNTGTGRLVFNQVPLLPVVELMCPIQSPRFQPVQGAKTRMLETLR